jgi:hypothetical protein
VELPLARVPGSLHAEVAHARGRGPLPALPTHWVEAVAVWPFKKRIPPPRQPRLVEVALERTVGALRFTMRAEVGDGGATEATRMLRDAMDRAIPGK